MGSLGMMLCLLMSVTLTATWASEGGQARAAGEPKKHREDLIRRYLISEMNEEIMAKGHRENMENLIRLYAKNEAERLGRAWLGFGRKNRRSLRVSEEKESVPFSARRFEKMLEKAILKIITGDLSTADTMLLKSLNYSLEEVLAIRERELGKKTKESEVPKVPKGPRRLDAGKVDRRATENGRTSTVSSGTRYRELEQGPTSEKVTGGTPKGTTVSSLSSSKKSKKHHENLDRDFDFDAYNRQAVYDYEDAANKMTQQSELDPLASVVDYDDRRKEVKEVDEADRDTHSNFDKAMEPHVVFKIRYDDSEFDSTSDERARRVAEARGGSLKVPRAENKNLVGDQYSKDKFASRVASKTASWSASKLGAPGSINTTPGNHEVKTFQSPANLDLRSSMPVGYRLGNFVTPHEENDGTTTEQAEGLDVSGKDVGMKDQSLENDTSETDETSSSTLESDKLQVDLLVKNESSDEFRRSGMYEGLEWVEDDVYRVIPQAIEALNYDSVYNDVDNDTVEDSEDNRNRTTYLESRMFYDEKNDTTTYQNESPEEENQSQQSRTNSSSRVPLNGLSTYQQLALAHRRDGNLSSSMDSQGQKAIEDIKMKVLAMTGRYNLSSSSNQVQRERLTMFSPSCQAPRNTDLETWSDPFSMNMYFQLNLTSGDHVVAAKMRIYKLPQANVTAASSAGTVEEEDDEEKKIRISIYFYTKSLKKHRSKKRLMDSVVTALTSQGSHLALDVRQALRFWRQNLRSSTHGNNSNNSNNNHGLVVQVEDQDGKPLKPSQYIQQGSCHTSDQNQDDKAYQRVPALFIQACSRYVRVVNGKAVTYVNCSKILRNDRH